MKRPAPASRTEDRHAALSCPFCGPRDETEFHFGGEAGKTRPEPAAEVSGGPWAATSTDREPERPDRARSGCHFACGEFFAMERDTLSMTVVAVESLREQGR